MENLCPRGDMIRKKCLLRIEGEIAIRVMRSCKEMGIRTAHPINQGENSLIL